MSQTSAAVSDVANAVTSVSGAADALANAPDTIAKVMDLAEKLVYGTGYTAAYVVVFPVALLFAAIPKRNALVQGIVDGAANANSRAKGMLR